jgi:hypothetical protein
VCMPALYLPQPTRSLGQAVLLLQVNRPAAYQATAKALLLMKSHNPSSLQMPGTQHAMWAPQ